MGIVYKVNQVFLDREFALKTINKSSISELAVRRFQQEARTAFSLAHPNIITVNDFGVFDDGTPYLAMELLNGETLDLRLKRTGSLSIDDAISLFVQVCFGLAYAHECSIIHRDIKPSNIMLLKGVPLGVEGSVKILDFGIAKLIKNEGGEIQALTRTGEIFGSPLYMSPEQCTGFNVDHRSDIYSLGCVLFEAVTGSPPFMGENALATMMKHQREQAPTLKEASMGGAYPKELEDIISQMLSKAPEHRYQNLSQVAFDLGALKRGQPISTRSGLVLTTGETTRATSAVIFVVTAVLFSLVGAASGYYFHDSLNNQTSSKPAMGDSSDKKMVDNETVGLARDIDKSVDAFPAPGESTTVKLSRRSIQSIIESNNGAHVRTFDFPDEPIGQVFQMPDLLGQRSMEPVIAKGKQPFPDSVPLVIKIGGSYPQLLNQPEVFRKIGVNEFDGLVLAKPRLIDSQKPSTLEQQTNEALETAKSWTNLKRLEILELPLNSKAAGSINAMHKLEYISFYNMQINDPKTFELTLPHLKVAHIIESQNVNEIIEQLKGSKQLLAITMTKCSFSPEFNTSALEKLSVKNFVLTSNPVPDAVLESILRIKTLKCVGVFYSKLTRKQIEALEHAKLKHIAVRVQN